MMTSMKRSLALVVVLSLLGGCTDGASPDDVADETPRASVATGYLLPREQPSDCELATGDFSENRPKRTYSAVLSPKDLDPNKVVDTIQVGVEPAEEDREVSADEAKINQERDVGGRTVRVAKTMDTVAIDWWQNGWRVKVIAADRHEELAIDTAAGVMPPPNGGKPDDTSVRVPDGLSMVADFTDRRMSASYTISTFHCGDREPQDVTMVVFFIDGGADPRVLLGLPGRAEKRSDRGRDYWIHAERGGITWTEGPAVVSVVTAVAEPELFEHVRSLRRVPREDVERWIAEAEKQRRSDT
jgi:hypothetical protein